MSAYKTTRAIEASCIDYLTTEINASWTGITCCKVFSRVYGIDLPVVCIRVNSTTYDKAEIGGDSLIREAQLIIDIFGTSMGNALDLKDFIISKLKGGCVYYDYTIVSGAVDTKTANGRIRFLDLADNSVNLEGDLSTLDRHDRYRWIISTSVSLGRVE